LGVRMKLETRKITDLKPNPNNPRILSPKAIEAVQNSIKEFGYIVPIIVDEDNNILAGHTRLEALKKENTKDVEVVVLKGLTEEQKKVVNIADNKTAELNEWDQEKLAKITKGIEDDLLKYGFSQEELNNLFKLTIEEKTDEDAAPATKPTDIKIGNLWTGAT